MALAYIVNPSPRRRKRRRVKKNPSARKHRRRSNPIVRRGKRRRSSFSGLRTFRRNPIGSIGGTVNDTIIPAAVGAAGAVGVDVAMNMLPIPDTMKTGPVGTLTKGGIAIGLGFVTSKFVSRKHGAAVALGGLTVVLANALRSFLISNVPSLPVAGLEEYPMMEYETGNSEMGALFRTDEAGMGALIDVPAEISGVQDNDNDNS